MHLRVQGTDHRLKGEIAVPASKGPPQRACLITRQPGEGQAEVAGCSFEPGEMLSKVALPQRIGRPRGCHDQQLRGREAHEVLE